jgi:branched-chain amino acid transport system substrate-binding protein
MHRQITIGLVTLWLVVLVAAQCSRWVSVADEWGLIVIPKGGTVKVGVSAIMAGDYAPYGNDMLHGCELAIADRGGAIRGFQVVAMPGDDHCTGAEATALAEKFCADPTVVGIVGPMCSTGCIPAVEVYGRNRKVMISPACTAGTVTARGYQSIFRLCPSDAQYANAAVRFMTDTLHVTRIACIHDKSIYGQGLADAVKARFEQAGGRVVAYAGVNRGEPDVASVVAQLKLAEPELVYYGGTDTEGALLVSQMRASGMTAIFMAGGGLPGVAMSAGLKSSFMGDDGFYSEATFLGPAGDAAEGCYIVFRQPETSPTFAEWLRHFEARYGRPAAYAPQAYDATMILLNAVEKVGVVGGDGSLAIGKKALADAVRAARHAGIAGVTAFDANGDNSAAAVAMYQVKGGKFEEAR